jgi:DNA-binding transcriptional LysR family regulator
VGKYWGSRGIGFRIKAPTTNAPSNANNPATHNTPPNPLTNACRASGCATVRAVSGNNDMAAGISPATTLPDGIEAVRLGSEGFVLALPQASWLLELKAIGCEHLQNETFILPEQISGTLHVAAQGGFAPRLGPQPGGLVAVVALVSLGQGVAVVPASMVGHVSLPGVVYSAVQGSEASSWLSLIHRRFEKAPAVARYIQQVKQGAKLEA